MPLNPEQNTKNLKEIIMFLPNFVTMGRLLLNIVAAFILGELPQTAGLLIIISVALDYIDGIIARKYNQCSFFGYLFDWVVDVLNLVIIGLWWSKVQSNLIFLPFLLLCLEITTMAVDMVSQCHGYQPKINVKGWRTLILKYTMDITKRGYTSVGLGYWNEIGHYTCLVSRIVYVCTNGQIWKTLFVICLPMSISFVWMHFAYTTTILEKWHEEGKKNKRVVKFIE